ncbi:MAG: NAD(P)H-hydrate dehydratase [Bacteroidia bacterium]|nr:NAD(P)H-hydrate dehydratase [Bacteroidia bacterium]
MKKITKNYVRAHIKKRDAFSNKNDYGHALIIAGNTGKMGAAVIAAKACLRSGTGLLTVSVPHDERFTMQTTIPEAMLEIRGVNEYDLHKFSAMGVGPGIGVDAFSEETFTHLMTNFNKPLLLDADVLTLLASNKNLLSKLPKNTIITPHRNEFDRLFGKHNNNTDRINTAIKKAHEFGIIIILKNHITAIIAPDKLFYNTTGNAGLAKGGSGDALTGIITAFLAQGYTPLTAAKIGVYLHGLAADITLKQQSMETMLITDVIENLGKALKKIMRK